MDINPVNSMAKFIQKSLSIIDAEQFLPSQNKIPKGVSDVYQMGSEEIWYTGQVRTIQGELIRVREGEWIIEEQGNPDRHYPISDKVFKEKYKPLLDNEVKTAEEIIYEEYTLYLIENKKAKPLPIEVEKFIKNAMIRYAKQQIV